MTCSHVAMKCGSSGRPRRLSPIGIDSRNMPLPVVPRVQLQGVSVRENDKLCAAAGEMRCDGVRVLDPLAPYLPVHGEDFAGAQYASSAGELDRVGVELRVDDVTPVA